MNLAIISRYFAHHHHPLGSYSFRVFDRGGLYYLSSFSFNPILKLMKKIEAFVGLVRSTGFNFRLILANFKDSNQMTTINSY